MKTKKPKFSKALKKTVKCFDFTMDRKFILHRLMNTPYDNQFSGPVKLSKEALRKLL